MNKQSFKQRTTHPVGQGLIIGLSLTLLSLPVFAQTIKIGALVAGQVIEVLVKPGQMVKAGQLLMKIDDGRYQAKLKSQTAQVEMMRLKMADAKINLDQAQDLYDRTVTAKREFDAVQLAYRLAEQSYLKAQADLADIQSWAKYFVIKAPVSARVKTIDAPTGTTVYKENTPLIQLER